MKYLLHLSGENPDLAREEALALSSSLHWMQKGCFLVFEAEKFPFERLAFARKACEFIFLCKKDEFLANVRAVDWQKFAKKSFYVHMSNPSAFNVSPAEIADEIWNKIERPLVKSQDPDLLAEFFVFNDEVFCGKLLWRNNEDFEARKAHRRPEFSPVSLHPKLARALVNLSGIRKSFVLDPFCGTAGILIEAGLMGFGIRGNDIDKRMLERSKANLLHYGLRKFVLTNKDATKMGLKAGAIVTDPPYGQSSKSSMPVARLIESFLANASKQMKKGSRLVIVLPNQLKVKTRLKVRKRIDFYVHKSLTKTINVFER